MKLRDVDNLDGCTFTLNTRYAKLCCEDEGATDAAFSAAWAGVVTFDGRNPKWAQTGFTRRRNAGSATIIQYRKAEAQGDTYHHNFDTANAPAEGSSHDYKIQLDKATGTWTFTFDGTDWETFQDDYWKTHFGTRVDYGGETLTTGDDMSGSAADKCVFTNCQFRTDGNAYQDAGPFTTSVNDDAGKFGLESADNTSLNIWDKSPH